jgi:hypothetical protein
MTSIARIIVYASISLMVLGQSSCVSAPDPPPTLPFIFETSTPTLTASSENTPTPEATSTSTATATITPTFTPAITATQLPELETPASGKGNVAGLVLWNNQPALRAAVWLCKEIQGSCKGVQQYRVNTDVNGYYLFKNVMPGKYIVAINSFNTGWFIFYLDQNGGREQTVSAGQDLILDPFNIWKLDLRTIAPRANKVFAEAKPAFRWEAYPGAAYYQISIHEINSKPVLEGQRVDGLEFTPTEPLISCGYTWVVDAFNEQGTLISSTNPRPLYFSVINVPGKC